MWIQYVFNSSYGFLTNLFKALHLDFLADVQWLDADHKFWALLISYCFGMIGHFMLIWVSGIERIGKDYYEAASIDGANKVGQLLYITLPLLKGDFPHERHHVVHQRVRFFYLVQAVLAYFRRHLDHCADGLHVRQAVWCGKHRRCGA